MKNTKTHEDLKELSIYVYNDGQGTMPEGWDIVKVDTNKKTGYYAEVYKKGKEVAIIYRGTDVDIYKGIKETTRDFGNDLRMGGMLEPKQTADAKGTFQAIKQEYPSSNIVLSGHSLGGSLAQLVSAETGTKAVTFNAFGTGKILSQKGYSQADQRLLNITNYGHHKDPVFMGNKDYQPGISYVTDTKLDTSNNYAYKQEKTKLSEIKDKLPHNNPHDIKNMGNLENAVRIEPAETQPSEKTLYGGVSYTETGTLAQNQNFSDIIRNKWRNMQQSRNSRLQNRSSKGKKSSASGTTNGKWITINGNHVFIEK